MSRTDSPLSATAHAEEQKNDILLAVVFMRVSSFGRELPSSKSHISDFYIAFFTQLGTVDIWEVREAKSVEKEWSSPTYSQLQNAVS